MVHQRPSKFVVGPGSACKLKACAKLAAMTVDAERSLKARMECLHEATTWVEAYCRDHGISGASVLRLTLIVEELFTNTEMHGHGGDSDAPVHLALDIQALQIVLSYADTAPPFDPLAHAARVDSLDAAGTDGRRVGGLGVALVIRMVASASYSRVDGWNRLQLVLPL